MTAHRPDFKSVEEARGGRGVGGKTKQEVVGRTPGATAFSSLWYWENDREVNNNEKQTNKGEPSSRVRLRSFQGGTKKKQNGGCGCFPPTPPHPSSPSWIIPNVKGDWSSRSGWRDAPRLCRAAKWLFSPRPSRFLNYCCHCARYYYINHVNRVWPPPLRWAPGVGQTFFCYSI